MHKSKDTSRPSSASSKQTYTGGIVHSFKAEDLYLTLTISFESERYFGRQSAQVRRTRTIRVLANPKFLSKTKS